MNTPTGQPGHLLLPVRHFSRKSFREIVKAKKNDSSSIGGIGIQKYHPTFFSVFQGMHKLKSATSQSEHICL
jgi:hypothetical protein